VPEGYKLPTGTTELRFFEGLSHDSRNKGNRHARCGRWASRRRHE
jgi:hypothetical protein